jgi:hypothetical protein
MKIVRARVQSIVDVDIEGNCEQEGKFLVTFPPKYDPAEAKKVILTSPYFVRYELGGVLTVPPVGSEVILFYDEELNKYYYVSTIVYHELWNKSEKPNPNKKPLIEKDFYNSKCRPQKMYFKDDRGAGLKIENQFTDEKEPILNEVSLNSVQGHVLRLSDSFQRDCVILRNKDGDGITITANKNLVHPSNSIEIKSKGNYRCVSLFGEIYMGLVEGRDISIVNNSAGYNANPLPQFGNVNLVSKWKDINIYSEGPTGNVLISTALGVIQLKSNEINVYGTTVNVNSVSSINIKSVAGNINLDSGGDINLKSARGINITARTTATMAGLAGTKVGRSATPLDLNSTVRITAPNLNIGVPIINDYGK